MQLQWPTAEFQTHFRVLNTLVPFVFHVGIEKLRPEVCRELATKHTV
jgi:hypothetical protein